MQKTTTERSNSLDMPSSTKYDVVVVGAGFAGMYLLHRFRKIGLSARVFETASSVGGTWYWNRYPGARCDTWSIEYSYKFSEELQQEWEWSELYATQPEIIRYAKHVADRFDLWKDIQFNTTVNSVVYDDLSAKWTVTTDAGDVCEARFCVMATGCISLPNKPKFQGLENFAGTWYHTARWPDEGVDFTGKRVAVIGTGSSGIQSIPIIAEQAQQLYVFQRTPNYSIPARNRLLDPSEVKEIKANYGEIRKRAQTTPGNQARLNLRKENAIDVPDSERLKEYQHRWNEGGSSFIGAFQDLLFNADSNETAADFVRDRIREIVHDPETAEKLCPDNVIGCKRLCVDSNYFEAFNRETVTLIDVSNEPIECIAEKGPKVGDHVYDVDAIVFATGFDNITGALLNVDILGAKGKILKEKWQDGPRSYLGLMTADFPNLFTVTGPGSPSVLTNMIPTIEQHVEWITDCIDYVIKNEYAAIQPTVEAEDDWVNHVNEVADMSLRTTCNSWYIGANIKGKPRVYMPYTGGFPAYLEKCKAVIANGYQGFRFS